MTTKAKVVAKDETPPAEEKPAEKAPEVTPLNEDVPEVPAEPEVPTEPDAELPAESPASDGASEETSSSAADTTMETPVVVPTALNPDTWPSKTAGTVTDPDILRRHGLEPQTTTINPAAATTTVVVNAPVVAPLPERPSEKHDLFRCLLKQLPSGHLDFWSDSHLHGEKVSCPQCGSTTVQRV